MIDTASGCCTAEPTPLSFDLETQREGPGSLETPLNTPLFLCQRTGLDLSLLTAGADLGFENRGGGAGGVIGVLA